MRECSPLVLAASLLAMLPFPARTAWAASAPAANIAASPLASAASTDAAGVTVVRHRELMEQEPDAGTTPTQSWRLHQNATSRTNLTRVSSEVAADIDPAAERSLYAVSGELTLSAADLEITLRAGDFIRIPAGLKHRYRVPAGKPAFFVGMDAPPAPSTEAATTIIRTLELMQRKPMPANSPNGGWNLYSSTTSRTNLVIFGAEVGRHLHPDAEHSLYLVSGEVIVNAGDLETTLVAGDYISIPAGLPHGYRLPADHPAMLISMDAPAYDSRKTVQLRDPNE